jgi:NTP pyrophosphatase (non-canonical NTP hydrolase)
MLSFDRLRIVNVMRCNAKYRPLQSWSPADWFAGVAEEVGEVARIIYRLKAGKYSETEARELMRHELADVVTYLDLLAARMGINLGQAVQEKFNIVSAKVGSEIRL